MTASAPRLLPALIVLPLLLAGCEDTSYSTPSADEAPMAIDDGFATFISAAEAKALADERSDALVFLDARSPEKFAAGHLPGAINLPPDAWRTPKAKPGTPGQPGRHFYRQGDDDAGPLDAAHYNRVLGDAGLAETDPVVVYGNHAGKADGSVPVMAMHLLGHRGDIYFLDGVGLDRLTDAGFALVTAPTPRPAVAYTATPRDEEVWDLADVRAEVDNPSGAVVLWDTRSLDEWEGRETRGNARPGRIPGAVRVDYAELFAPGGKTVLPRDAMRAKLADAGITPDKTVVLYCQTATRVALPYQALRELGYDKLAIYDGSMAEYANLDDTVVETSPTP
ncbi:MAG: rhodanese-like domain-containing protein [Planctomycetota bacterium]